MNVERDTAAQGKAVRTIAPVPPKRSGIGSAVTGRGLTDVSKTKKISGAAIERRDEVGIG